MSTLSALIAALDLGSIEVIDLTSPLSSSTPVIQLPARVRADRQVRARGDQQV